MKIKRKRNFQVRYSLMKLLEILKFKPHVVTSLSQNLVKETQFVYHVQLAVKISKSGHAITLVQNFFSDGRISQF